MPNSANPIIVAALRINNSLPGMDDQKCLLSLTINTLNWLLNIRFSLTRVRSFSHSR
ncbi:MAG: hypothetical protein HY034_02285 [Nitrospirae bacterium]|nr:hypothetical protein [Nitrospirota bacterium]